MSQFIKRKILGVELTALPCRLSSRVFFLPGHGKQLFNKQEAEQWVAKMRAAKAASAPQPLRFVREKYKVMPPT